MNKYEEQREFFTDMFINGDCNYLDYLNEEIAKIVAEVGKGVYEEEKRIDRAISECYKELQVVYSTGLSRTLKQIFNDEYPEINPNILEKIATEEMNNCVYEWNIPSCLEE